ncbi:MAG: tetratricopeptide repeat protein [Phycisphaerae bacterium]
MLAAPLAPAAPPGVEAARPTADDRATLQAYYAGNGLLQRGLHEMAAAEYRRFLADHADHEKAPLARYGLAVCLFQLHQADEALAAVKPLLELEKFDFAAEVRVMVGQLCLARGDFPAAAAAFAVVGEQFPDHRLAADAAAGLVEALQRAGRNGPAAQAAERAIRRFPKSAALERVHYFAGLAAVATQHDPAAEPHFNALLQEHPSGDFAPLARLQLAGCRQRAADLPAALKLYQEIAAHGPEAQRPAALRGVAAVSAAGGNWAEARRALTEAADKFPADADRPATLLELARAELELRDFKSATARLDAIGARSSSADQVGYLRAKALLRQEQFAAAADQLAAVEKQFPETPLLPEIRFDAAVALARTEKPGRALAALDRFSRHHANHPLAPRALQLRAELLHRLGRYDDSGAACQQFRERFPADPAAAAIAYLACENNFLARRYDVAVAGLRQFLNDHSGDGNALRARYRLGICLARLDKPADAERELSAVTDAKSPDAALHGAWAVLGQLAFARQDWPAAESRLARSLERPGGETPRDDVLLRLGIAQARQGHHPVALSTFDLLAHDFPQSPHLVQATFERGQCELALKHDAAARSAFEAVVKSDPSGRFAPFAVNQLAALALRSGDAATAARWSRRLTELAPGDDALRADAQYRLGEARLAAGEFKSAAAAFDEFLKSFPKDARRDAAAARRAIALARADDCAAAADLLGRLDLARLDDALANIVRAELAWCLRKLDRPDDARALLVPLRDSNATDDAALHARLALAALDMDAQQFAPAAELLTPLRSQLAALGSPAAGLRADVTYRLALCEYHRGRKPQAVELLKEFLALSPDDTSAPAARALLGATLADLGRCGDAVETLTRVAKESSDAATFGPALLRLGECHTALQRWPAAEAAFGEYLARLPDGPARFQARFGLGWALEHQQRIDEALSAYREVASHHTGETAARAQFQIGECLYARRQWDAAARELMKVDILFAFPEWSAAALYEAGRCLDERGQRVEARQQFKRVVEKYGDSKWAALAREKLAAPSDPGLPGRE